MIIVVFLVTFFFIVLLYGMYKRAEIQFSPVIGFMIGGLISWEEFEDGTDYTLQCCVGFISITIIWTDQITG